MVCACHCLATHACIRSACHLSNEYLSPTKRISFVLLHCQKQLLAIMEFINEIELNRLYMHKPANLISAARTKQYCFNSFCCALFNGIDTDQRFLAMSPWPLPICLILRLICPSPWCTWQQCMYSGDIGLAIGT